MVSSEDLVQKQDNDDEGGHKAHKDRCQEVTKDVEVPDEDHGARQW